MIRQGCRFNEANYATADEAEVIDKPAEADEAEEAADESDEADNTNEAIDAEEAEANEADTVKAKASVADKAEARVSEDEAEVTEIDEADEADLTNDADVVDKAIATIDIKLDDLDKQLRLTIPTRRSSPTTSMKSKRPLHLTRPLMPMSLRLTRLICPL
jgi:hypothetical protein